MKTFGSIVFGLLAASASMAAAVPTGGRLVDRAPQANAVGGILGGLGNTVADVAQGIVGAAGGIAGDVVNTPLDLLGNILGKREGTGNGAVEEGLEDEEEEEE